MKKKKTCPSRPSCQSRQSQQFHQSARSSSSSNASLSTSNSKFKRAASSRAFASGKFVTVEDVHVVFVSVEVDNSN